MLDEYLTSDMCKWIELYKDSVTDVTLAENENMYMGIGRIIVDTDCFVSKNMLQSIVSSLCNGSVYANQSTLKKGFITLNNGYRVGMTGTAVADDGGNITHLRNITCVNIRISRTVPGAAREIIGHIQKSGRVFNTLIIAPPGAGKTTLLRDIAISLGRSLRVGVADERDEIIPQGMTKEHVYVMRNAKKSDGMLLMLRSMSPQTILTDEIGTDEDEAAVFKTINAGVKVICTAHGYSEKDLLRREIFQKLIRERVFETIVVLSSRNGPGTVEKIIHTKEQNDG